MDEILFNQPRKRHHAPVPAEPDMFDTRPAWLAVPETDLEKRFADFHRANPRVYAELEKKALSLLESGRTRIGIAELVEDLRYDHSLKTAGDHFKLNNSYRSFYSRLLIHNHSKLASVIAVRDQTHQQKAEQ